MEAFRVSYAPRFARPQCRPAARGLSLVNFGQTEVTAS